MTDNNFGLKPCPFCGGIPVLYVDDGVCVICTDCKSRTGKKADYVIQGKPAGGAIKRVIEIWNKRTPSN